MSNLKHLSLKELKEEQASEMRHKLYRRKKIEMHYDKIKYHENKLNGIATRLIWINKYIKEKEIVEANRQKHSLSGHSETRPKGVLQF